MNGHENCRVANERRVAKALAMFEDAEWMLDNSETFDGIMRRLGTTWDTFSRRLIRHDRGDLYERLLERRSHSKIGV
jgi:hypothetical protein